MFIFLYYLDTSNLLLGNLYIYIKRFNFLTGSKLAHDVICEPHTYLGRQLC
jgi:hypothetical protein